jgi:hypothetical protein
MIQPIGPRNNPAKKPATPRPLTSPMIAPTSPRTPRTTITITISFSTFDKMPRSFRRADQLRYTVQCRAG